jgi:formate hydrogenlyase subunit 3/multisubunit Na+/H+ antiporter MnhD subunit
MAKDRILGFIFFLFGILIWLYYTINVFIIPIFHRFWPSILGWFPHILESEIVPSWYWFLAFPMWLALTLVLFIVIWIGWTMFRTPPPVPFEELEKEEESKVKKKKPAKKAKKTE